MNSWSQSARRRFGLTETVQRRYSTPVQLWRGSVSPELTGSDNVGLLTRQFTYSSPEPKSKQILVSQEEHFRQLSEVFQSECVTDTEGSSGHRDWMTRPNMVDGASWPGYQPYSTESRWVIVSVRWSRAVFKPSRLIQDTAHCNLRKNTDGFVMGEQGLCLGELSSRGANVISGHQVLWMTCFYLFPWPGFTIESLDWPGLPVLSGFRFSKRFKWHFIPALFKVMRGWNRWKLAFWLRNMDPSWTRGPLSSRPGVREGLPRRPYPFFLHHNAALTGQATQQVGVNQTCSVTWHPIAFTYWRVYVPLPHTTPTTFVMLLYHAVRNTTCYHRTIP